MSEIWNELSNSFNIMMGAQTGKLETPFTIETSTGGNRAEAEGSIRHICEFIEETDYDYQAEYEYMGEAESLTNSDDARHQYKITLTREE